MSALLIAMQVHTFTAVNASGNGGGLYSNSGAEKCYGECFETSREQKTATWRGRWAECKHNMLSILYHGYGIGLDLLEADLLCLGASGGSKCIC